MGAGDDEQILLVLEPARLVVGHVGEPHLDALGLGFFGERCGQALLFPVSLANRTVKSRVAGAAAGRSWEGGASSAMSDTAAAVRA